MESPKTRSLRRAAALAALACSAIPAAPASAEKIFPAVGARGDGERQLRCPAGQFVVGIKGRYGAWIDQIQIVCAPLDENHFAQGRSFTSEALGGGGGSPDEGYCGPGGMMVGMKRSLTPDQRMVKFVQPVCLGSARNSEKPLEQMSFSERAFDRMTHQGPEQYRARPRYLGAGDEIHMPGGEDLICASDLQIYRENPSGNHDYKQVFSEAVTGLVVRYGRHVNAIGMICDTLPVPARAAPPPSPPKRQISSSGRAAGTTSAAASGAPSRFNTIYESESSLGGKFDLTFKVVGMYSKPQRAHFTGTITNTDIGPEYNGTFDGSALISDTQTMTLNYTQPAANAHGTVVFRFSEDGETFTGEGKHMGTVPFQWTGRRKQAN